MSSKPTTIRLDDQLKEQLDVRLKAAGLTLNGYFTMAARQFVVQNKLPFDVLVPDEIPTEETRKALVEAEAKELGLIPDDSPRFSTAKELIAYLESEVEDV